MNEDLIIDCQIQEVVQPVNCESVHCSRNVTNKSRAIADVYAMDSLIVGCKKNQVVGVMNSNL